MDNDNQTERGLPNVPTSYWIALGGLVLSALTAMTVWGEFNNPTVKMRAETFERVCGR